MLPYIAIDNFRAFREKCEFEFAPITVLTGTNSSGKSSLVDALRIMQSYTGEIPEPDNRYFWNKIINFKDSNLHDRIPGFKDLVNYDTRRDTISFEFQCRFIGMVDLVTVCLEYQKKDENGINGLLKSLVFKNNEGNEFIKIEVNDDINKPEDAYNSLEIDLGFLQEKFLEEIKKEIKFYDTIFNTKSLNLLSTESLLTELLDIHKGLYTYYYNKFINDPYSKNDKIPFPPFTFDENNIVKPILEYMFSYSFRFPERPLEFTKNENGLYKKIKEDFEKGAPFYDIIGYFDAHRELYTMAKLKKEPDGRLEEDNLFIKKILTKKICIGDISKDGNFEIDDFSPIICAFQQPLMSLHLFEETYYLGKRFDDAILKENYNIISNYWYEYEIYPGDFITNLGTVYFDKFIYNNFVSVFKQIQSQLDFDYIPSIRNTPERFYTKNKKGYFENLLSEFYEKNPVANDDIRTFLEVNLSRFKIGELLPVERHPDFAVYSVYIQKNNRKINLLDLGYGVSQIMPILLKIALTAHEGKVKTIVIEEPETNLHPALQSKLADMFVEANKLFGIQFIIETHSEYLIRRLQGMVVNKDITTDTIKMYYFNNPEEIPEGEPQVYPITIEADGALSNNFGKGFLDEAANLNIALYNYTKGQHN